MGTVVVGESLIDIVVGPAGVAEHVGGSPLNVAAGLGRLGREVLFASQVGDDSRGAAIVRHLEGAGVRVAPGSVVGQPTSTARATLDAAGAATYEFDLRWALPAVELPPAGSSAGGPPAAGPLAAPALIHTGSVAAFLHPGASAVLDLFERWHGRATLTFDPNIRPGLIADPAAARRRVDRLVELSDMVKASDEDLRWYDPTHSPEDVARDWLGRGPSVVAVTMGARGAFGVCRAGELRVPPRPVEVVDTVGAGDAFMAGAIDALWSLDLVGPARRAGLRALTLAQLREVLDTATLNSALTVAVAGADLPTKARRDAAR